MDIETVLTAFISAGTVAVAVGYAVKKIVERSVNANCTRIAEQALAEIRRVVQHRLSLLDQRFEFLKTVLSLAESARICCRDLQCFLDSGRKSGEHLLLMNRLKHYADTILDILTEEKAAISPRILTKAQEVKALLQEYPWNTEIFIRSWRREGNAPLMAFNLAPLKERVAEFQHRMETLQEVIRQELQEGMRLFAANGDPDQGTTTPLKP